MAENPLNIKGKLQSIIQQKLLNNTGEAKLRYYTNMFRYSPKKKAMLIDGAFFETYNLIKGKQKERLDDARRKSLQLQKRLKPDTNDSNELSYSLDDELRLDLFREVVFTTMHRIGAQSCGEKSEELIAYAQKALAISEEECTKTLQYMDTFKAPKMIINVKIISGVDLRSKDANGLSDPYCMLCVVRKGETLIQGKSKRNALREFQHDHKVEVTRVIDQSTAPTWNEEFSFELNDMNDQVLHVDVWDKDDDDVVLDTENKIKSIRGFGNARRLLTDMYQARAGKEKNDFLGLIEIPLNTINEEGTDKWYQLESRKLHKKVDYGHLHLDISLSFQDSTFTCNPLLRSTHIYEQLLGCFSHDSVSTHFGNMPSVAWDCTLPTCANVLLYQYQHLHSIKPLSTTVIKLQELSKLFSEVSISLESLYQLLREYSHMSEENIVENIEEDSASFLVSLEHLKNCLLEKIKRHKLFFSYDNNEQLSELETLLRCSHHIYKLPIFQANFDSGLSTEIDELLIESTCRRFEQIKASFNLDGEDMTEMITNAVDFTNTINAELKADYEFHQPIFQLIIYDDYYKKSFNTMEKLICPIIENIAENVKIKLREAVVENDSVAETYTTKMFEFYISVRTMLKLKHKLVESERGKGLLCTYSDWFRGAVVDWMNVAASKAKTRLTRSVELDELVVIDEMVKHSTSALDVTWCLRQICTFWAELDWENPTDLYMFLVRITDVISECCILYSTIILDKLHSKNLYDTNGDFYVTDGLCIMMNDLGHVMDFIKKITDYLPYGDTIKKLGEIYGVETIPRFDHTLKAILDCAYDDMNNKIIKIMAHLSLKFKGTLLPHISRVAKTSKTSYENALEVLMTYIDKNLITLNSTLIVQVFQRILKCLWEVFLTSTDEVLTFERKNLVASQYKSCGNMIDSMKCFFYGDGNGLTEEQINSKNLHELQSLLNLYKTSTEELIEQFIELCCNYSRQKGQSMEMGSLTFKAYYSQTDSVLNLQILNCRDLKPLDNTGSIDPYITLSLVPNHQFPVQEKRRTRTKEKDFYPIYDEVFQFKIPDPAQLKPGLALMFNLYDKDLFTRDDLYGEIFFSLDNILVMDKGSQMNSFGEASQIELSWGFIPMKGKVLETIKERSSYDQIALDFFTSRGITHKRMQSNNKRSTRIYQKSRRK